MLRIAKALEEIARALSYFAVADARRNGQMFSLTRPSTNWRDESELLHTDSAAIAASRQRDLELVIQQGYAALEADEENDS